MADVAALERLHVGYVEPLGDPLQNFYTTSSAEQSQWNATRTRTTASSFEVLDEVASSLLAASPSNNSDYSEVSALMSEPASNIIAGTRKRNETSESSTILAGQDIDKRHLMLSNKDDTDSSGREFIARRLDNSDAISLCTDSGIESVAASVQLSGKSNPKQSTVRTVDQTFAGKPRSHIRSASDCGVQTAKSKAAASSSRKLSVTYSEQGVCNFADSLV